jgi:hypothetical protein
MKGSEFAATVGKQSLQAWESAAFDLEKSGANIRPIFVPVPLAHKDGRTAVIDVATDYFSVGEEGDFIRLPLLPVTAQKIGNLTGLLMPTPMLVYRIWQAAIKLKRQSIAALGESNKGPNFAQYVKHNAAIQEQISGTPRSTLLSGHKKDIVVSNLMKPGHVVIFGWYKPAPDVFNDGTPWTTPDRQPQQAHSNEHGDFYVDYSHGVRFLSPLMTIEGKDVETEKVFTDSDLSGFVSNEGPVRKPRYPAPFPAGGPDPIASNALFQPLTTPGYADVGTEVLIELSRG